MATSSNNQYAPPRSAVADLATSEGTERATRLSRLGASIIDGLILGLPFAPSYFAAFSTLAHQGRFTASNLGMAMAATGLLLYAAVLIDLVILTIVAVLVHRNGQTIGKKLLGIKVVRTDGSRATLGRIFWLRNFVNSLFTLIPLAGRVYGLVDPLMIFGEARRCCHDYIADTIVIRA
jgi:uncharacterized RDD family membrane protein YckC